MDPTATQTISLWDALTSVPDHRCPAGKRYSLASLLLIALAAMLAGRRDQLGIVRWGRRLKGETLKSDFDSYLLKMGLKAALSAKTIATPP